MSLASWPAAGPRAVAALFPMVPPPFGGGAHLPPCGGAACSPSFGGDAHSPPVGGGLHSPPIGGEHCPDAASSGFRGRGPLRPVPPTLGAGGAKIERNRPRADRTGACAAPARATAPMREPLQ